MDDRVQAGVLVKSGRWSARAYARRVTCDVAGLFRVRNEILLGNLLHLSPAPGVNCSRGTGKRQRWRPKDLTRRKG